MANGVEIRAQGLVKSFDGDLVRALDGVDLELLPGQRVALTGPTGCGKSTLLSLLAMLDEPDSGELIIDGRAARAVRSPERWRRDNLGIVFQLHHLLPQLTISENVGLPLVGRGMARAQVQERVTRCLDRLQLLSRADVLAARVSGGERQLAAVARALVGSPRLVLADEPTGSVDSATGARIVETLLAWAEESCGTLFVVSHDASVAESMDRVLRMLDGRILASTR
jgi:ABC-type lipoprotein export system ATPase subunit